jgi:lipoprotein-anchoring transpeptidase ErfK/SrfK
VGEGLTRPGDRRARRLAGAAAVGVLLLAAAWFAVRSASDRRYASMQSAAEAAGAAVQAARLEDATRWAPDDLAAAERAARDALTRQRVEQEGSWLLPDASAVVEAWAVAERAARRAANVARVRHAASADSAAAQIEEASRAVSDAEAVAKMIHLGPERQWLARARAALNEAQSYQRGGDLATAAARAKDASALAGQATDRAVALAGRYADAETVARWQRWKAEAIEWSRRERRPAIVVVKDTHQMTVYLGGSAVKTYSVELGFNWIADKRQEGDGATPEGRYRVVTRMDHLSSDYYRALLIDFPNAEDRDRFARARRSGDLPGTARIGGLIEIHGSGGRGHDWTNGCVAVPNADMDDLFRRVGVGTPVTIIGSDQFGPIAEFVRRNRREAGDGRN